MSCADQKTEPFALDLRLTDDQRREYDDEFIAPPPLVDYPPSRRSKVDADRLLSILDELAGGGE